MAKEKKGKEEKPRKRVSRVGCVHDYAYCYYDKKEKCNVYQCVNCGKFSYQ